MLNVDDKLIAWCYIRGIFNFLMGFFMAILAVFVSFKFLKASSSESCLIHNYQYDNIILHLINKTSRFNIENIKEDIVEHYKTSKELKICNVVIEDIKVLTELIG